MKVLQLIDSLEAGGAERVAVNIANALSSNIEGSFLCATRKEGLLKESLSTKVGYLFLNKTKTLDFTAIKTLSSFIKEHEIQIIHAHSSSFFLATLIKLLNRKIIVIWHDHFGNSEFLSNRKAGVLKWCSKYFTHIFSVNKSLETWAKQNLKCRSVTYLPNFATINQVLAKTSLKGEEGKRIVCLANLRPQKDYITLLEAFAIVLKRHPDWTLHGIGKSFNDDYAKSIDNKIKELDLSKSVYLYGIKPDIYNILNQCEIGVLSSKSEGLPIALLEYGLAKLAVVATKVGECESVIAHQHNGILVNPSMPNELSNALSLYIENPELRHDFAMRFNRQIEKNFSQKKQIETILSTYNSYLK
ncbi:glycosyltransferase [Sabulilitoribacter multivorans]|uniref:Glycosyltransferase n=1 Tax=Flaviramulus multivorans TaxID=1304750 RepID=A0ABS9IHS3_9FLAO|nr:glycosyltransferase [Flaviramulus multivorans]MCF7560306.1 glycosyltransferase [Flaviramulus multivorans]